MTSTSTRSSDDSEIRPLRVGAVPDSWEFLNELAEAEYKWLELAPYD